MKHIYLLQHRYEYQFEGEMFEEVKIIGMYSSREKAKKVMQEFKKLPGFKDHPIDCFYIDKYEIDKSYWEEGFGL